MSHTIHDKKKLLARVKKIQGQANALEKSLNDEVRCDEVLQQIAAIKGAINGLMITVIEGHLKTHIVEQVSHEKRKQDLDVVLQVIKSYLK